MRHQADTLRLPIELGPVSSDEYDPIPPSPAVREAARRSLVAASDHARRTGLSRRDFLRSTAGAALTLFCLNACTREAAIPGPTGPGGGYAVPPEATIDRETATATLDGDEFVFDVQSHLLEYDTSEPLPRSWFGAHFPQAACGENDPRACYTVEHYLELLFLQSDTTMAVLSAVPIAPRDDHPLSIEVMERARGLTDRLCGAGRLLVHGQAHPTIGPLDTVLAGMADLARSHPIAAWKIYTHVPGTPWRLDDANPDVPQVGNAFVEQAKRLGIPRICVHKGVSGGDEWASPADVGPAARTHPEVDFIVYHSGWEPGVREGPYTPQSRNRGVSRLITSLLDNGLGPGGNVYAELGTTWFNLMRNPTEAAHVIGKLLAHLGEDNIMWGTDSIWYGAPQQQIIAFRTFEISPEFQERYGYPPLTPAIKRKILGGNASRVYGVDPATVRCAFDRADLDEIRSTT